MLQTLKKLKGHIVFGSSVRSSLLASVTVFMPTVVFEPLKIEYYIYLTTLLTSPVVFLLYFQNG